MLGHKTSLNKFNSIEIISSIFSDHNSMKLEINHRERNKKKPSTRRLNNILLKKPMGQQEKSKKLKNTLRQMTMKTQP